MQGGYIHDVYSLPELASNSLTFHLVYILIDYFGSKIHLDKCYYGITPLLATPHRTTPHSSAHLPYPRYLPRIFTWLHRLSSYLYPRDLHRRNTPRQPNRSPVIQPMAGTHIFCRAGNTRHKGNERAPARAYTVPGIVIPLSRGMEARARRATTVIVQGEE